jgi:two-component system phosphate regulon response regulator OmpR
MSSALLLAEPEEATRSFLERHLAQDGFEVVGAEDGEALDLLERVCPDLVLIGDPEGLELCSRLRERDRDVPVILLGAQQSDPVDRVRAFDRGCDDYLDRASESLFAACEAAPGDTRTPAFRSRRAPSPPRE